MALPSSEDEILLLHNPNCSKSRATLDLLNDRGVAFQTRLYLENPLSKEDLVELGQRLARPALEYTRPKQKEFSAAGLDDSSTEDEIHAAVAATPILMERPILIRGDRAVIGRPPEDVLRLLED